MGIDLGRCVSEGFADVRRNPAFTIVGFLLFTLVNALTFGLLTGPLMLGYFRGIAKERSGGRASIGDVFSGFDTFLPAFLVGLLGGIAIFFGTLLCVIPGLLITPVVPIGLFLVLRGETDGMRALSRGFSILGAHLLMAALTTWLSYLVGSLGMIACYIGVFVSMPVAFGSLYSMAEQATATDDASHGGLLQT